MRRSESPICPLEWRYGSPEMKKLFTQEALLRKRLHVETALAHGLAAAGIISDEAARRIEAAAAKVGVERVNELEAKLGHDIMAIATALAEEAGEAGKYVHLGATSYDIVDTAWALILRDALNITKKKLVKLLEILLDYADKYRNAVMPGRTHGQHALPITLGFKFANYAYELARSLERIIQLEDRLIRGKISGAVGTMAAWGGKGLVVESEALKTLGLSPHPITTQVAPRDGFAELVAVMAILGSQLDRLAIEVRELMRPEIGELAEGVGERVGSSTMPQKKNPVTAEKISGLAKVLRGLVIVGLENIPLWHERDLSNSSSERIEIPHVMLIIDEMLDSAVYLMENLVVDTCRMRRNLEVTQGAIMAEAVMISLVNKGLARHKAHELLRTIRKRAETRGVGFWEELVRDDIIRSRLSPEEIKELLKPENYLGSCSELINRAKKYVEDIIEKAGFSQV